MIIIEFDIARQQADALNAEVNRLSNVLNAINGASNGPMGLTPDHIKATLEWKQAKAEFDRAFQSLRRYNSWYVKRFKKEIIAYRNAQRISNPNVV